MLMFVMVSSSKSRSFKSKNKRIDFHPYVWFSSTHRKVTFVRVDFLENGVLIMDSFQHEIIWESEADREQNSRDGKEHR